MRALLIRALFAAALFAAAGANAQPAAVVEGVQMPAWVERDGVRSPIQPGMLLQPGDVIHTGAGSRLRVRMSEKSLVKLGENGHLRFTQLSATKELFKAALGVLEGAFRFTTDIAVKNRRREVSITVANVTAGLRGTDLWGRSHDDMQVVCLIEGAIEVGAPGEQPAVMDQPRQFYRRVGGQTQPIGFIEPAQLAQWSQQTEIRPGRGALRSGGRFQVVLARAASQADALKVYDELRAAGYPAEIAPRREAEALTYVVRIRQLPSRAEAQALAKELSGKFGIGEASVGG
ncbi:MAG: hypothetical protein EPO20_02625 [Betaproteobacteria bacterium]|nr:MAG: hypothetical protein EPO20_02625 [Betaproteobacteria bacterium]